MGVKASASITLSSVVDIEDAQRYYKLQESTLPKPEKPTTNPPEGWSKTEPSYTNGSTSCLYFCDLTLFSDGSFSYSEVSLSSSYEAAKEAYKKASSAEDTATQLVTRVTNAEASITKNSRAIELRATKTEVTEAVNNVQIGGVNRALNTGTPKTVSSNGGSDQCTFLYHFANSFFIDIGENEIVTTSFDWETTATSGRFQIQGNGDPSYPTFDWDVVVNESNTSGHRVKTTRTNGDARSIAIRCDDLVGTVTISNFKIEKGNKATDWSPAPEDVANDAASKADQALAAAKSYSDSQLSVQADRITSAVSQIDSLGERTSTLEQTAEGFTVSLGTVDAKAGEAASAAAAAQSTANTAKQNAIAAKAAADDAAKTATNYLGFSNNGLVVGDMHSTTLKRNVLIDDDSVDIRNGDTVLASYGDDYVDLGKNSTSSVIKLCGDSARISNNTVTLEEDPDNPRSTLSLIASNGVRIGQDQKYNGASFYDDVTTITHGYDGDTPEGETADGSKYVITAEQRLAGHYSSTQVERTYYAPNASGSVEFDGVPYIKTSVQRGYVDISAPGLSSGKTMANTVIGSSHHKSGANRVVSMTFWAFEDTGYILVSSYAKSGASRNGKLDDWVVDSGTSGIWGYRKWASGVAECWCSSSVGFNFTTAWAAGWYRSGMLNNKAYPFTFTETPEIFMDVRFTGTDVMCLYGFSAMSGGSLPSSTQTGTIVFCQPAKDTINRTAYVNYYVVGKWK